MDGSKSRPPERREESRDRSSKRGEHETGGTPKERTEKTGCFLGRGRTNSPGVMRAGRKAVIIRAGVKALTVVLEEIWDQGGSDGQGC